MSLSIAIVGLPNVGKSTLFNALTKQQVLAANYPFATIEPNKGIVPLPDYRLDVLGKMFNSQKVVPATVEFVDIAGLVKGASIGEGLGNKFLANIRECDAICEVVRAFEDDDIQHVSDKIDPQSDIETIETELILADLQTLENAIPRFEKNARGDKEQAAVLEEAHKAKELLERGLTAFQAISQKQLDYELIQELQLLSAKPFIYAFNLSSAELSDEAKKSALQSLTNGAAAIFLDAEFEMEISELEPDEAVEFLEMSGLSESGLNQLARVGFETLGLQTYLTAGEKESKAWTIHKGWTAPQAAGVIHTDFEKGFIKAEIVSYNDLIEAGDMHKAKEKGKVRMEGKEYIMQDGDIVNFRFNN